MKLVLSTRAVSPFHGYGGMERYYYYLAKHLVEQGVNVEIVTSLDGTRRRRKKHDNINYTLLPPDFNNKPLISLWYKFFNMNVKKYLQKIQFDILHGTGGTYPYVLLKDRKPVVAQPFGMEIYKTKSVLIKIYKKFVLLDYQDRKLFHLADAIASEGDLQTQEIMNFFKVSRKKIFTLPDGVDLDLIELYVSNAKITRRDLGVKDADLVLMNVNRLEPNKGIPYLIEAVKILNEALNVKLILVGAGSQEQKIKKLIKKLELQDKVTHFKNIPDKKMFQLYTLADISVTPTLYEGLPLVVLEAMAAGKPIVASNVSEVPQVVKNGKNGFLVKPASPKAIAEAVSKIYDRNLIKKMGEKSRKIVKDYDWEIIAKKAIREYERLIEK